MICGRLAFILIWITIGISAIYAEVCPAAEKKEWTYRRDHLNGPEHWGGGCKGQQQSPINIITSNVMETYNPQILMLRNFDKPIEEIEIHNNGWVVQITPKDGVNRSLILNGNEYPFHAFHFHVGDLVNDGGSEHTIDGRRFPMEVHFLFNGNHFQVSSLFEINNDINPAMNNILSVRRSFKYEGDKFEGKIEKNHTNPRRRGKIYLDDILDLNCPYYFYIGSSAAPPCAEGITYLICKTHKYIKYPQLRRLYTVDTVTKEEDVQNDCLMKNNNRPLQESNNRPVYG